MSRFPFSMYCRLAGIEGFFQEKAVAEHTIDEHANGRSCICVLPVLEDGRHYYVQCSFRREPGDTGTFKFVNTLQALCDQQVLPALDRAHSVEAYLFLDAKARDAFASQPIHRNIKGKFEVVRDS